MVHARGRGHYSFRIDRRLAMPGERKRSKLLTFYFCVNLNGNSINSNIQL